MKDSESIRWNSISFNPLNANACELCVCAGSRRATNLISFAFFAFPDKVNCMKYSLVIRMCIQMSAVEWAHERREWKLWSIYVKTDDLCLDDRNKSMSLICIRTLNIRATGSQQKCLCANQGRECSAGDDRCRRPPLLRLPVCLTY